MARSRISTKVFDYVVVPAIATVTFAGVLYANFRNNPQSNYVPPSSPAIYEVAKSLPSRAPSIDISSTSIPVNSPTTKDYEQNFKRLTTEYDAALKKQELYNAKVKAIETIEKENARNKLKAKQDALKKIEESTPEYRDKVYDAKREAIKRVEDEMDRDGRKPVQVIGSYVPDFSKQQEVREAKIRAIAQCEALNNREEEKRMERIGIPYTGPEPEAVQDYKPGQKISISVQDISPPVVRAVSAPGFESYNAQLKAKTQDHPLRDYANYSTGLTDPKVGSDTSKGNLDNAERAFTRAGQNLVDAFTASSFNPERKPISYSSSANDFVSYFDKGGESIWDTINPNSKVYNKQGIPARIIGLPTAVAGVALGIPFEILSFGSANITDNTLEKLLLEFPDEMAEGIAQTANAPGNLVSKKGFGYHLRRAYSSTLRFFKNVLTGKGFWNARNAREAFAKKGNLASLESALNTAAFGAGAAGVTFFGSDSGGFEVFNPAAPITPTSGTLSGTSFGSVTGR